MTTQEDNRQRFYNRKSMRLQGYDYTQPGAYFVTLCTHKRLCLFGEIVQGKMILNSLGQIVFEEWMRSEEIRSEIELDDFVIMPNHLHGVVWMVGEDHPVGASGRKPLRKHEFGDWLPQQKDDFRGPRPKSLSAFVSGFESACTKRINHIRKTPGLRLWQRNYYDHIIRNDEDLHRIIEYIRFNPAQWEEDEYFE